MNKSKKIFFLFLFPYFISSCIVINLFSQKNNENNSNFQVIDQFSLNNHDEFHESNTPKTIEPTEVEFNLSTIDRNIPDNVLNEITYYVGGGGGTCVQEGLYWNRESFGMDMEIMTLDHVVVCGWKENEDVSVKIIYPDGRVEQKNSKAIHEEFDYFYTSVDLKFDLDSPEGEYEVIFSGDSGEVTATIYVYKPNGIRLYRIDESHLLLYNFMPNESVNLIYYENEIFFGWQKYEVSKEGQLIIKIPVDENSRYIHYSSQFFAAIGEKSGETHLLFETEGSPRQLVQQKKIYWVCGEKPTRLNLYCEAKVAFVDGEDVFIRESPAINSTIIDQLPEGTKITIGFENPICSDNITWWKISGDRNIPDGWVAEYDSNNYLLEPIN